MNGSTQDMEKASAGPKCPGVRFGRQLRWTKEEEALVGTGPDDEVARKLNRTVSAVQNRRNVLKIPMFGYMARPLRSARWFPWTKDEDALLGKLSDREVAERFNRPVGGVRVRRKSLGIAAASQAPQPYRMAREPRDNYAHLFATKSNQEIHALLGWGYKRIQTRRRQLAAGLPRKCYPKWTLEEDQLLGTKPDKALARQFGRTVQAVTARRGLKRIRLMKQWRSEDDKILGTRPDLQVALLLGRSKTNVSWRRKKLGISAKAGPRPWTAEEKALLGTKPDAELAELFGRTVEAVAARRAILGRPMPQAKVRVVRVVGKAASRGAPTASNVERGASYCSWTPEEDALLGKLTDAEVAEKLGYSVQRVAGRRQRLGLKSFNPKRPGWTPEQLALLGTRPDREVASVIGKTLANVRFRRIALGIPFCNPQYEIWKPDELALLGKVPDAEVAARTRHSLSSVRQARQKRRIPNVRATAPRWRPEEVAVLGTAPDKEIAARLNRTVPAVTHRRTVKGIPAFRNPDVIAGTAWTSAEESLLGTMSDADLAQKLARTAAAVGIRRGVLRIPRFLASDPIANNSTPSD